VIFLELIAPDNTELSDFVLAHFKDNNHDFSIKDLSTLVREHLVYFQNKPVPFLPFKIYKKGKIQLYLKTEGYSIKPKDIIFEDKWLLALNKPSGLSSQASLTFLQDHAHSVVQCYLREKKFQTSPPLFLLHRLDKDTSGVLLFSKKASANKEIQKQFESRKIKKTYLAHSKSKNSIPIKKGESKVIESFMARAPDKEHSFKFASVDKSKQGAKRAETKIQLLESEGEDYFFKVFPKTGRSHQIRVHLLEEGFPILGDRFYKGDKASHLHLHAWKLSLKHPISEEELIFEAPLPKHMAQSLDKRSWSL